MKLYFVGGWDKERFLQEVDSIHGAQKVMGDFMRERNFKSYYTRMYMCGERLRFDVGSWYEFFELEGPDVQDVYNKYLGK